MNYDNWPGLDVYGFKCQYYNPVVLDKDAHINTFLHYSEPDVKERTVFGEKKKGLFYNYSDRLYGSRWDEGLEKAAKEAKPSTARFFEIALNHFHEVDNVDLQHIILGCNMSNGFSYLIFGYTYEK